jgi:hypothetical protein
MRLYGRQAEQRAIDNLLARAREGRSAAVVVRGEAGIGKTALLDYAAVAADGMLVLRAVGIETEAELAFAGLHLLLRPVLDRIEALPGPQATALRGALGLSEIGSRDRFLAGLAVLSLMSDLAEDRPVLCLIDDAHWLDRASADALLFTARRLEAEGVVMVLAARAGPPPFATPGLCDLTLAPLDSDQASQLLEERAGLSRRVLAEVFARQGPRQCLGRVFIEFSGAPDLHRAVRVPGIEDREADPRIPGQVECLAPARCGGEQHRVTVTHDPHHGRLWRAVGIQRRHGREVPAVQQFTRYLVQHQSH